ncbi:MAG: hypothetical protein GFH27_549291n285 [Chloroflexi bacterium AL-W]|nr:hypothetical protein [Chloroflexi bacterium AL-N1]NOK67247.1 hypothetical protein [Chloroflexi bacterium AL-N10]NOK75259.1 hypothetical protein [Chloroflexi bacterium AL-N5]NOK82047.1 hypothetical protein [Chloroflexi bacterium AL-W]NOK89892.1 hypothetical protein [Chloroflexi bacterium AL-N15]
MSRRLSIHITIWSCLSLMLLGACRAVPVAQERNPAPEDTTPIATADASAADRPDELAAIKEGIQATLDRYTEAHRTNDVTIIERLMAPSNRALSRKMVVEFEDTMMIFGSDYAFAHTVQDVTPRDHGFMQAHIRTETGSAADWLFREVDGEWLFAEPGEDLLGARAVSEYEHFTLYHYAWSHVAEEHIVAIVEEARAMAGERLGRLPDAPLDVHIRPVTGLPRLTDGGRGKGIYQPSYSEAVSDYIAISAPYSFGFGFYDPDLGWGDTLQHLITHEYAHFVTHRAFVSTDDMAPWMFEGLAEYVADAYYDDVLRDVADQDLFIPIIDTENRFSMQDLEHMHQGLQDENGVDYALAYSLVVYITETYGGLEGFWELVETYTPRRDFDAALQEVFGVQYETFEQDWQTWVINRYGS